MSRPEVESSGSVKSARRVLDIIELLSRHPDGLTFQQLADELGLPKSSLHGLLGTLSDRRWLVIDEMTRRYRVGIRAWESGQGYRALADLASTASAHLLAARVELDETVQLAVLDDTEVVYVAQVDSDRPFGLVSKVGMRLPAYATGLGKVLLAALPLEELHARLKGTVFEPFTAQTVRNMEELERRLAEIRARGVGTDIAEYTEGVCCVAAPVVDSSGRVVAAMSCSVSEARLRAMDMDFEQLGKILVKHARAFSQSLGWMPSSMRVGS